MRDKIKFCALCSGKLYRKKIEPDDVLRLVCVECGFINFQNPTPTVLALIGKESQILLVKRKYDPCKGYWDLPGGFLEVGQNLEDAVKTEIREELGVGVNSMAYFKSSVSSYETKHSIEDIVGVAFVVTLDSYNLVPGSDVLEANFFNLNNLPEIADFKDVQESIKKYIQEKNDSN